MCHLSFYAWLHSIIPMLSSGIRVVTPDCTLVLCMAMQYFMSIICCNFIHFEDLVVCIFLLLFYFLFSSYLLDRKLQMSRSQISEGNNFFNMRETIPNNSIQIFSNLHHAVQVSGTNRTMLSSGIESKITAISKFEQ